jgi:hypothetical protein
MTFIATLLWNVRVEFVTGVKHRKLEGIIRDDEFTYIHGSDVAEVEVFDCLIPISVYPTAPEVGSLYHPKKSIKLP